MILRWKTQNWENSAYNWKIDYVETKCDVLQTVTIICVTYVQKKKKKIDFRFKL